MAEEQKVDGNIVAEVKRGIDKARREALKASLKTDLEELFKSSSLTNNILAGIEKKLAESGENSEGIREILGL